MDVEKLMDEDVDEVILETDVDDMMYGYILHLPTLAGTMHRGINRISV